MIEFSHVRKGYGGEAVIPDFSLRVMQHDFVTVVGSSGCGKTTVLKMINGLEMPDGGDVIVEGKSIRGRDLIQLRRNIGYVIQGNVLFPHMTVEKNICYVPNLLNKQDKTRTRKALYDCLATVGLEEALLPRYPDELSGGQQQRVGIARAIASKPYILLMDEPFGAVDEITRKQLQDEMKRIHKTAGVTVVFVTHDIKEALHLGSKVLVMQAGQAVQYAPPEEILAAPATPFVRDLVQGQAPCNIQ